jgi:hypothetical protein
MKMGILSKMKSRRIKEVKQDEPEVEYKQKTVSKKKKDETSIEDLPEITNVEDWLKEITKMAKDGLDEIDEHYNELAGKAKDISNVVLNLGIVMSNYLSFRYNVYAKLAEYYNDYDKAFNEADKAIESIDREFTSKLVGVIRRWMKEKG